MPQFVCVWEDGHSKIQLCVFFNLVCLLGSSVVAENDFLHTLLNKVTASRGDSGGQGTDPHRKKMAFSSCLVSITLWVKKENHYADG